MGMRREPRTLQRSAVSARRDVAGRWGGSQVCGPWQPWEKGLGRDAHSSLLPFGPRRPYPPRNPGVGGSPLSLRASWPLMPQVRSQPPITQDVTSDILSQVTQSSP